MTTSGVSTFNQNRNQICKTALRKIGAIQAGETPGAQIMSDASDALNSMIKRWMTIGIHVWTETEATLFLQPNQVSYNLGSGSTDHCTETFTATTLSADASSGATTIEVTSATDFAASYNVGVVLDSGDLFWTTESGAPSGTTITLASGLSGQVSSGNAVYVYQSDIVRPLRVPMARRFQFQGSIDTPLRMMSRQEYRDQPNKTNTGTITQAFYDPKGGANTRGQIFVWPAPPDVTNALKFTWWRPIQDFITAADTPDLPQEWIDTLTFNLAVVLAPEYDCPPQRYAMIKSLADEFMDANTGFDREPESVYMGVNFDQR